MTEKTIINKLNTKTGIVTLTLNRPRLHNAFDETLIADFTAELRRLGADPAVRVLVLAATGQSFSAGADMHWMQRMAGYSEAENLDDARKLAELMQVLNEFPKPTVAQVQGAAFGGGVGLVACCDIAIASDKAAFCLSEVKLGLIPAVISPYVVRAIGERQARRYFLSAERFDAREARRIGLVHEVVPADELEERVARLVELLRANGPQALTAVKDLIRRVASGPVDEPMIDDTARRIAALRVSDEGQEGLAAFLHKRQPDWCDD